MGVLKPAQSHSWSVTDWGFKPSKSESYLLCQKEFVNQNIIYIYVYMLKIKDIKNDTQMNETFKQMNKKSKAYCLKRYY